MATASGFLRLAPWMPASRVRLKLDLQSTSRVWSQAKNHFSASYHDTHPSARAIEKIPYPTTKLDYSIFEEETIEYASVASASEGKLILTASQKLLQLVVEGKFADAEVLRTEMIASQTPIFPDFGFEKAAKDAIKTNHRGGRVQAFKQWFSLTPSFSGQVRKFRGIQELLLAKSDQPDLEMMMAFAILASQKGYASMHISKSIIPCVVGHAPVDVSWPFIEKYLESARVWDATNVKPEGQSGVSSLETGRRNFERDTYLFAVRTHLQTGYIQDAVDLFLRIHAHGTWFSRSAFLILSEHLKRTGDQHYSKFFDIVKELKPEDISQLPDKQTLFTASASRKRAVTRIKAVRSLKQNAGRAITAASLNHRYLQLRRIIRQTSDEPQPLLVPELTSFILDYKNHSSSLRSSRELEEQKLSPSLLTHLYRSCTHQGPQRTSDWALVEMLYHRRRNEHRLVMLTFQRYFWVVGVPQSILRFVSEQLKHTGSKRRSRIGRPILCPDNFLIPHSLVPTKKIWPTPYHTALVWNALVWSCPQRIVRSLYDHLVEQAYAIGSKVNTIPLGLSNPRITHNDLDKTTGQTPTSTTSTEDTVSTAASHADDISHSKDGQHFKLRHTPSHDVDAAHFLPFVLAFSSRVASIPPRSRRPPLQTESGSQTSELDMYRYTSGRVLQDMLNLGIKPSIELWTAFAGTEAQYGRPEHAIRVLDLMDTHNSTPSTPSPDEVQTHPRQTTAQMPPAGIETYTHVLKGLIKSGHFTLALALKDRLVEKFQYEGGRPRTDAVLSELDEHHRRLHSASRLGRSTEATPNGR